MSDIFLSYSRKDEARVRPIVEHLEAQGWSVFWDRVIPPGQRWEDYIEKHLDAAECVVVVWSKHSVTSDWVRAEAGEGKSRKILVPVQIDQVKLSLNFRELQAADLTDWKNDAGNAQFRLLINTIAEIVPIPHKEEISAEPSISQDASQSEQSSPQEQPQETLSGSQETQPAASSSVQDVSKEDIQDIFKSAQLKDEHSKTNGHAKLWSALAIIMVVLVTYLFIHPVLSKASLPENFVLIKGGQFTMGSPESEDGRGVDETQHEVKVDDFAMCKYEVTVGEYLEFVRETKSHYPEWMEKKNENNDYIAAKDSLYQKLGEALKKQNYPIVGVSWNDTVAYCRWLSKKKGGSYRLPTSAEWEYACRAGTSTPFNTGENLTTDQANYNGNFPYRNNPKGEYRGKTVAVNFFQPNVFGLYNMHGNVWELCSDWYAKNFYNECKIQGVVTNPNGPSFGFVHLFRGGSWMDGSDVSRSAYFYAISPTDRLPSIGFRLVFIPQS